MTAFITTHRESFGVEPICTVLQTAPSTYYDTIGRTPTRRVQHDEVLKVEIRRVHAELALDALEMAIWSRQGDDLAGLVHHSDRGVQYLAIRYTDRLADEGAVRSVGSRGDSYDNALAETVNGL